MRELLKSRGILAEEFQNDTWNLLSETQLDESFPGLSSSRSIITFNRTKALQREDYEFLTIDHPAVSGGIDIFLSSETGNACFAIHKNSALSELLLETIFVTECIAPQSLYINRFLAPFVFRIIIDNKGKNRSDNIDSRFFESLENIKSFPFIDKVEIKRKLLPSMINQAEKIAMEKCNSVINDALEKVNRIAGSEVKRLVSLKKLNPSVSVQEITIAENEYHQLMETVKKATPRLEAVRLIWCAGKLP